MSYVIIIISYRSRRYIIYTIRSVIRAISSTTSRWKLQKLIIVDYQTTQEILSEIEKILNNNEVQFEIIELPIDKGLMHMRLYSMVHILSKCVECDKFIFIDNDVILSEEALRMILESLDSWKVVGMIGCHTHGIDFNVQSAGVMMDLSARSFPLKVAGSQPVPTMYSSGCMFGLSRNAVKILVPALSIYYRLFPFWFEDALIGMLLLKSKLINVVLPCKIYHIGGGSYSDLNLGTYLVKVCKNQYRDRVKMTALIVPNIFHFIVAVLLIMMDSLVFGISTKRLGLLFSLSGFLQGLKFVRWVRPYRTMLIDDDLFNMLKRMVRLHLIDLAKRIMSRL